MIFLGSQSVHVYCAKFMLTVFETSNAIIILHRDKTHKKNQNA